MDDDNKKEYNIFDLGYDKNLNKIDTQNEENDRVRHRLQMEKEEKERQEGLRIQRISMTGKSPLLYTLDIIIEKCLMHSQNEINFFDLGFSGDMAGVRNAKKLFGLLKIEQCFEDFELIHTSSRIIFTIQKPDIKLLREYKSKFLSSEGIKQVSKPKDDKKLKNFPKTIYLITPSVAVKDMIFLVIDENYASPIIFRAKNSKGEETSVKKLHDIAYPYDVPGGKIVYSERLADNINNGLFKNPEIERYMKSNKLDKPTLVRKAGKENFVLASQTLVKDFVATQVPTQYRHLYIEKTR